MSCWMEHWCSWWSGLSYKWKYHTKNTNTLYLLWRWWCLEINMPQLAFAGSPLSQRATLFCLTARNLFDEDRHHVPDHSHHDDVLDHSHDDAESNDCNDCDHWGENWWIVSLRVLTCNFCAQSLWETICHFNLESASTSTHISTSENLIRINIGAEWKPEMMKTRSEIMSRLSEQVIGIKRRVNPGWQGGSSENSVICQLGFASWRGGRGRGDWTEEVVSFPHYLCICVFVFHDDYQTSKWWKSQQIRDWWGERWLNGGASPPP